MLEFRMCARLSTFSSSSSYFNFCSSCNNNNSTSLPMSTHRHCTLCFFFFSTYSMNTCSIPEFTCPLMDNPNECYSMHSRTTRTTAKTSIKAKLAKKKSKKYGSCDALVVVAKSSLQVQMCCDQRLFLFFFFCFFRSPRK